MVKKKFFIFFLFFFIFFLFFFFSSSPGRKSIDIYLQMKGKGKLVCCEKSKFRMKDLKENLNKFDLKENIVLINIDSTLLSHQPLSAIEKENEGIFNYQFDKILLDAPCSGIGFYFLIYLLFYFFFFFNFFFFYSK